MHECMEGTAMSNVRGVSLSWLIYAAMVKEVHVNYAQPRPPFRPKSEGPRDGWEHYDMW